MTEITDKVPRAKARLKNVYRVDPDGKPRSGYVRLDMNEGVHGLPGSFTRAVMSKVTSEYLASYPEYSLLRSKIARHNRIKKENVYITNGSDGAIKNIFDAFISENDRVLLTDPTFAMYPVYCRIFGAHAVSVEYKADMSFPDKKFLKHITGQVKMAVVVNPNNPTGTVVSRKILKLIIEKARFLGTLIIVDEAYFYYWDETVMDLINKYKNLVVLRTFSKLCGMASARLGYAAAHPDIIAALNKVKPTYDVNGLAALLAKNLLDNPGVITNMVKAVSAGRRYIINMLEHAGIEYRAGSANFILIKCGEAASEVIARLSSQRKILVGGPFKNDFLKGYIRVTLGDVETMKKFWKGFDRVYREVRIT
jgi:histidinol-phosphate aminotransferase